MREPLHDRKVDIKAIMPANMLTCIIHVNLQVTERYGYYNETHTTGKSAFPA